MKKINTLLLILGFCFSSQVLSATNPISIKSYDEIVNKTETKSSIYAKAKVWFKNDADKVKYNKLAKAALIVGLVSLSGWPLVFLGIGFPGMFIAMGLMALAADIIAIIVLVGTSNEKGEHKKLRKMAIWGLVAALLTGLLPIGLLFGVFVLL